MKNRNFLNLLSYYIKTTKKLPIMNNQTVMHVANNGKVFDTEAEVILENLKSEIIQRMDYNISYNDLDTFRDIMQKMKVDTELGNLISEFIIASR